MWALLLLLAAGCITTEGVTTWWPSVAIPEPAYDVTTVYKLRGDVSAGESRLGLVKVPDCYVEGNSCAWTATGGWQESDSNSTLSPYPLEVYEGTNTMYQEVHVFRKPANKLAISVKLLSSYGEFFLFLMKEKDVDRSDMLVMRLRNTNHGSSATYKCLQTNIMTNRMDMLTPLPTMTNRQCTALSDFGSDFAYWDTLSYQGFSVEFEEKSIQLVKLGDKPVLYQIPIPKEFRELDGLINFVGIRLNGAFKYNIPVDVLALSASKGVLLSPDITPPKPSSLLCVQMFAYLHPDSGASIAMSMKFSNGTTLNVGEIHPSKNKVEKWRFMCDFQADKDQSFRIQVAAIRDNTNSVVLSGISTCEVAGEFSNLVFDQPEPAEIHMRTNARGLPLLLPNGIITGPKVGVRIPECRPNSEGCKWVRNNFTRSSTDAMMQPLLYLDNSNNFVDYTTGAKHITNPRLFSTPLNFTYDVTNGDSSGVISIFLMDSRQHFMQSDMYFLTIRHNGDFGNYPSYLYKCTHADRSSQPTMPGGITRLCSEKGSKNYDGYFYTNGKYTFNVETNDGRIVLTIITGGRKDLLFDWIDSNPIETTHFAFGSDNVIGTLLGVPDYLIFSLSKNTGSLTSPPLPPNLERVCLSLAFYTTSLESVIDLRLLQGDVETRLGTFTSGKGRQTEVWEHQNIIADIPSWSRGERRLVVLATRQQLDSPLYIQWVGGCNPEAPEDFVVMPNQSSIIAVDVSHVFEYSTVALPACSNGGVRKLSGECVCRPGFTGKTCSEGCGANSYGTDCGGVCSESSDIGCRGLAFCNPVLGCDCGPGYKGFLCDTPCDSGEYGAGCRQRCGQCAEESCDAYTGICHQGCQHGRFPPFCHDLYSYISTPPVVTVNGFYEVNVMANLQALKGKGKPQFDQIQYKEDNDSTWTHETPRLYSAGTTTPDEDEDSVVAMSTSLQDLGRVTGLKPGSEYQLRVVLIDESLASYQGSHVPTTAFATPCIVPEEADYLFYNTQTEANNVKSVFVGDEGFEVEWKVSRGNVTWCALIGYELHVKADWRKIVHSVASDVTRKVVTGLSPGKEYNVKVRGVTTRGTAAFSQSLTLTTSDLAPDHVLNLRKTLTTEKGIKITWEKPRHPAGLIRKYLVKYQCLRLGACPEVDCGDSAGQLEVMTTDAQLEGLLPYALYKISVAGISGSLGLTSSIQAVTTLDVPDVAPSSATPDVLSRSNSSFTVQWTPPSSCRQINGYLTGYRYELFSPGQKAPLLVGTTTNQKASFSGLVPHSQFLVRVFATNSAGWGSTEVLEINAKTRATTPEVVENLTVYKRGRRFLGLRWSPPRLTYGSLESFTVTHRPLDDEESRKPVTATLKPSPCPAWPHLYCHTIKNLKADADYILAVQARNSEVPEDGDEATIKATTKEGAPNAPSFLRVVNKTDVSMTIEWGLPDLVNGQLRSFLVNIEETDSHNSSDCCQYFPLREVIVTDEKFSYQFQITGLKASSSYEVGVTAKTVSLGPALSATAHTRPPTPVLAHAPELMEPAFVGQNLKVRVQPTEGYEEDIISGYLLLLKTETSRDDSSPILDDYLANELNLALNGSFSLAAEFSHADLPESGIVELHPGQPMVDGVFGSVGLRPLEPNTQYQVVWVLVLEYCGARSVGLIRGVAFTASQA